MILWAIVAGALIGWFAADWSEPGLILGGILGAAMGTWLRKELRLEIAREWQRLTDAGAFVPEAVPVATEGPAAPEESPWTPAAARTAAIAIEPADRQEVPAEPEAHPEPEPARPSLAESALGHLITWFTGGNTIVRSALSSCSWAWFSWHGWWPMPDSIRWRHGWPRWA